MRLLFVLLFCLAWLGVCWLGMMAVHELGHIAAAIASGGSVTKVVLSPVAISRTDVSPNPYPALVVWLGPIFGALFPLLIWSVIPRSWVWPKGLLQFFAGFCLIANGAYLGIGSLEQVGDCKEILRTGSPVWTMWLFGLLAIPSGFWLWHQLGSPVELMKEDSPINSKAAWWAATALALIAGTAWLVSPV
ncbi:hypothetical protein C5Y96_11585 [Blastopirellula marina]|uniref:Peptidase M50 domain-containing protein n=1 Tax=Blastopirellula marina TaxID=124 RepID=A0A2S8FMP5_9BACT|nr:MULTISPECIES: hypothetical protein [Pirellulaceae]PQO33473.1 hypothetical protein C5Y96_11585 [Blastopirellula marina]RCS52564.1 hypothetical protein DTL36_11595 [Bremerella cremea]